MENKKSLRRLYMVAIPILLLVVGIVSKLIHIQWVQGAELRQQAQEEVVKPIAISATRGSIFSADGKLLATNMPVYKLHLDPTVAKDEVFDAGIQALSEGLAHFLHNGRTAAEWHRLLVNARKQNNRFVTLSRSVDHGSLQSIKELPILKEGRYQGGIIIEPVNFRKHPLGKIAERTIGYDESFRKFGLEAAYSSELSGKDGSRLAQKISKGQWKPLTDYYSVEPVDGKDLISTIDTRLQDIAHHALLGALERHDADHGCAVLMDVHTGAIRAIVNLGRNSEGSGYYEKRNYAVWESTEPGSTFKTIALMAALEDKLVDTAMHVDTQNGLYEVVPGAKVKDSNYRNGKGGYGVISLGEALAKSSNTAIVKALYPVYAENPQLFVDRLYALGLDRPLDLKLPGEGVPKIPQPGDRNWSGLSLPWMLFGYEVSFTPLQILTMYNAIANDGIMIKPRFVERMEVMGKPVQAFDAEVIHPSICSKETRLQLQDLLRQVVESDRGTAQNIRTAGLPMAGKTGTCQLNYWLKDGEVDYQSSFVGYFPADAPEYSCIVVIHKPRQGGYYGSTVAAPVFRQIALGVQRLSPRALDELPSQLAQLPQQNHLQEALQLLRNERMPNMRGMRLNEALEIMENHGLQVKINGFAGQVRGQWPRAGEPLPPAGTIILEAG